MPAMISQGSGRRALPSCADLRILNHGAHSCDGIVRVRQVDVCATAFYYDWDSDGVARCALLETRLDTVRPGRIRRARHRRRLPASLDYGMQLYRHRGRNPPQGCRRRFLVRSAAKNLHGWNPGEDRDELWSGAAGNGAWLPGKDRRRIFPVCLDLSCAAAAEAIKILRGIAAGSGLYLLHEPGTGEALFDGCSVNGHPGERSLMPQFSNKRRVQHSASEMFDLVADVERYPEFVPLCSTLKIRQRTQRPDGTEIVVCDMTVSFKLIREAFTSRVTLDRPNLKILVEYLRGPFSNLENRWSFEPKADDACDVGFFISYEFRSRMLAMLMGTMFDAAFQRFAAAFEKRADAIYGKAA